MIVKNRLLNFSDKIIYQDDDCFLFSLDSILLPNFVTVKLTDKNIIDLCCGNAPGPMLLSFRTKARIFGVEIQKDIYELGLKSVLDNKMMDQITLICDDVKNISQHFDSETFDIVTCNPPYFKYEKNSLVNTNDKKAIARHEVMINLEDILKSANYLLKNKGTFAMVHRPDRLMEIFDLMRKYNLEPKKIRFIYPKKDKECNMILIEGIKNGNAGLKIISPLITHNEDETYCDEIRDMFGN